MISFDTKSSPSKCLVLFKIDLTLKKIKKTDIDFEVYKNTEAGSKANSIVCIRCLSCVIYRAFLLQLFCPQLKIKEKLSKQNNITLHTPIADILRMLMAVGLSNKYITQLYDQHCQTGLSALPDVHFSFFLRLAGKRPI